MGLNDLIPVLSHPGEESVETLGVATQPNNGHIDVLVLDLAVEDHFQGLLNQLWIRSTTKDAKEGVALIGVGRCTVDCSCLLILHRC